MTPARSGGPLPSTRDRDTSAPAKGLMRTSVELRGPWSFRRVPGEGEDANAAKACPDGWMSATVPGCVHVDLLANEKVLDPFVGQNEADQQWIDKCCWEYSTSFVVDDTAWSRQRLDLVWKGLDTYADISLNGIPILAANNMFREWRVDVRPLVRRGTNRLLVQFRSPIAEGRSAQDRLGYVLPATNDQAVPMVSMYTRKAPYHFGWDWGPRLVTSGIWRPVYLEAWDDARIDDVQVVQTALTEERATLRVTATVNGTAISGNSDKGGSANAPTAPETKARPRLRQPQDRMTPSMSEARLLARGIMAESATLKESPFLIGRIAIADHSPNAGRVRLGRSSRRR